MNTVLPALEKSLDEAATRHYRRRRTHRAFGLAGLVAAVAAAAVAIAVVPRSGGKPDERPATQRVPVAPDDPLGRAYAIVAETGPAPDPELWRELHLDITFDWSSSSIWRVADRAGGARTVVAAGFNAVSEQRLVCVFMVDDNATGGICKPAAKLITGNRPWVLPIGTGPIVLVQNDVERVWLELADGSERELIPRNNIAIGSGDNACFIRWLRADGSHGRAAVDGAPQERCG